MNIFQSKYNISSGVLKFFTCIADKNNEITPLGSKLLLYHFVQNIVLHWIATKKSKFLKDCIKCCSAFDAPITITEIQRKNEDF